MSNSRDWIYCLDCSVRWRYSRAVLDFREDSWEDLRVSY